MYVADATLEARLFDELQRMPILDPHSHINPLAAPARSLDDILGYHYYTELAHSAGMDKGPLAADVAAAERAAAIARFLPAIENTVQYSWLLDIARVFFGFTGEAISAANIADLFDRAAARTAAADWEQQVWQRSRLERIFLTNDFDDPLEDFDTRRYVPCLRTDDLVFHLANPRTVERLKRASGMDVGDAGSLVAAIARLFEHFVRRGAKACAISLPPDFEPVAVPRDAADPLVRSILATQTMTTDEMRTVSQFVFWTLARHCADFRLPFDLMVGVNRRVYRDGVFQGQDLFDQRTSLVQYRELFNAFPQVTFPISVLSSGQNQELVSHAWIFPNVVTNGHWWYSNVPAYIEADLRARITTVPATKQVGYYSDAYKLEFVLPKFNMYRRVLSRVLAAEFVQGRGWSETRALQLARQLLRDNATRVFGLDA
jgi:glucuronate isomerase